MSSLAVLRFPPGIENLLHTVQQNLYYNGCDARVLALPPVVVVAAAAADLPAPHLPIDAGGAPVVRLPRLRLRLPRAQSLRAGAPLAAADNITVRPTRGVGGLPLAGRFALWVDFDWETPPDFAAIDAWLGPQWQPAAGRADESGRAAVLLGTTEHLPAGATLDQPQPFAAAPAPTTARAVASARMVPPVTPVAGVQTLLFNEAETAGRDGEAVGRPCTRTIVVCEQRLLRVLKL